MNRLTLEQLAKVVGLKLAKEFNLTLIGCWLGGSLVRGYFDDRFSDIDLKFIHTPLNPKIVKFSVYSSKLNKNVDITSVSIEYAKLAMQNGDFKTIEYLSNDPLFINNNSESANLLIALDNINVHTYTQSLKDFMNIDFNLFLVNQSRSNYVLSSKYFLHFCYHFINLKYINKYKKCLTLSTIDRFIVNLNNIKLIRLYKLIVKDRTKIKTLSNYDIDYLRNLIQS